MTDKYTTLRVTKSTRDIINKIAKDKDISPEQLLVMFTKSKEDTTKQIILNVDRDKFYVIQKISNMLHQWEQIKFPTAQEAMLFAFDKVVEGLEQGLQKAKENQGGINVGTNMPNL